MKQATKAVGIARQSLVSRTRLMTLDVGEVSDATAGSWLSATMLVAVAEYHRRTTAERVKATHEARNAEGKWLGGRNVVHGYRKGDDGRLEIVADEAAHVREAFAMRARGDGLETIRAYLREVSGKEWKSLNMVTRLLRFTGRSFRRPSDRMVYAVVEGEIDSETQIQVWLERELSQLPRR